jgi:hypothetical protein
MDFITLDQQAREAVKLYAGAPIELTRQLNKLGIRYVKVQRGSSVRYILRGEKIRRTEIKL